MGRAWLFSSLLHLALGALLYFGLPSLTRPPPAMERAITVELVNAAETEPEPPAPAPAATAPQPERVAATPEPPPPPPEPASEPEPERAAVTPEPPPPPEPAPPPPEPEPALPPSEPEPEPAVAPEPPPVVEPEVARPPPPPPTPRPSLKPPEPQLAAPEPPPKPEPPKSEPPKEDAFAALLRSVEKLDRQVEGETVQAGKGRGQTAAGQARQAIGEARLSFSEIDALRRQIGRCWTLPVGVEGIGDMVVQLRIQVRPDRTVQSVTIEDQGRLGRDPLFRAVAESARRAVDKCSPLNLPPGKYAVWRDIVMKFYPEDAITG